jgi:hypothetical protein
VKRHVATCGGPLEHSVGHASMQMHMLVERRAKAVLERDRTQPRAGLSRCVTNFFTLTSSLWMATRDKVAGEPQLQFSGDPLMSHMSGQTLATRRNSQVEFVVHFVLEQFVEQLRSCGEIVRFNSTTQKSFISEIASDVWDHYFELTRPDEKGIELWCQTTCYKGNAKGKAEPNKTYEVRETLTEAISLRERFTHLNAEQDVAEHYSIHATVGDKKYTYKWFSKLKDATFDNSIYISTEGADIFELIAKSFDGLYTDQEKKEALLECIRLNNKLGKQISAAVGELNSWWLDESNRRSSLADEQWRLVESEIARTRSSWPDVSALQGSGIKKLVNDAVFEKDVEISDPLVSRTAAKLLKKNPFLNSVFGILEDWDSYANRWREQAESCSDTRQYVTRLWGSSLPERMSIRRVLLRLHTNEGIEYIADREIEGITEHNLYGGDHDSSQTDEIVGQILENFHSVGWTEPEQIAQAVTSRGKRILNSAKWFEAQNGTQLRPSFDYVQFALEDRGFKLNTPGKSKIRLLGYHAMVSTETVRPYTNFKIVQNSVGKNLCILKAKFFREQEFPRRCKEEAFIALTLRHTYENSEFSASDNLPLIMFVDMQSGFTPPAYSVYRMISFGWRPVFSVPELVSVLRACEG